MTKTSGDFQDPLYRRLIDIQKEMKELEAQISNCQEILKANKNVGLHESLVDSEGFPRNDIDVYLVRHTRVQLIKLQNDYKALAKTAEEGLFKYHEVHRNDEIDKRGRGPTLTNNIVKKLGIVGRVEEGSPSAMAGMREGDVIVEFGNINSSNMKGLKDFAAEAKKHSDMYFKVIVLREGNLKRFNLKPKNSHLGCVILEP